MLLDVKGLRKEYRSLGREPVTSLGDVYLRIEEGEAVGLVGESGSGKTTLIRCLMRLERPDSGSVAYDGMDVLRARGADLRRLRREVQLVFQDPNSSLNPRMTVAELVAEGLIVHRLERSARARRDRVAEVLAMVGLDPRDMERHPRSFSGGQRQRIAIARALAVRPRLLVCDEPVSALDVSVQAQVMNLLQDMHDQLGLAILFVAHDLAVVRQLCTRISVLRTGTVVEEGTREQVFSAPRHVYTQALLAAVPVPDPAAARTRTAVRPQGLTLP